MVVEGCYSHDPQTLLAFVVEERSVCYTFLPVEEIDPKFLYLLDNDDQEGTAVDRRSGMVKGS